MHNLIVQLEKIQLGDPCIMVGTQMLAKGHHFPQVTLVAVINADAGFLSPDFRAPERTAQLIVQVAGRAGRAEKQGEVWIQSYQPENPLLQRLISQGYRGFAEAELRSRMQAGLPPAQPMAMLRAESIDPSLARDFLSRCKASIRVGSEKPTEYDRTQYSRPHSCPHGSRCKTDTISIGGTGGNSIGAASGPCQFRPPQNASQLAMVYRR